MSGRSNASWQIIVIRLLKIVVGVLFFVSNGLALLGLPADIPTWYRCIRYNAKYCPVRIGWASSDFDLILRILGLCIGLALLVSGSVWPRVTRRLRTIRSLKGPTREVSPLRITFDEHDRMCVDKIIDKGEGLPKLRFVMFRVVVTNRSKVTIGNVRVLVEVRDRPSMGEVPLRFLLDTSKDGQPSIRGYDLEPETRNLVNVVHWDPLHKEHSDKFVLKYAIPDLSNTLLISEAHGIDLTARGKNVPPFRKQFNLHIDQDGVPRFQRAAIDLTRPEEDQ